MEFSVVKKGDLLEKGDNRLKEGWAQWYRMQYGTDIDQEKDGLCISFESRDGS